VPLDSFDLQETTQLDRQVALEEEPVKKVPFKLFSSDKSLNTTFTFFTDTTKFAQEQPNTK